MTMPFHLLSCLLATILSSSCHELCAGGMADLGVNRLAALDKDDNST